MKERYPALYRALRTFIQAAIGVVIAAVAAVYGHVEQVEWQAVIVLAVSTGLAALMNLPKSDISDEEESIDESEDE